MEKISSMKREKFVRLAEARVNNALKAIRLIGNLSNKNNYQYSDKDVQKIVAALNLAVKEMSNQFRPGAERNSDYFSLGEE